MNISVIVPIYNEESYIGECIRALLSQDYPVDQYEIIMVDNNSVDRSVEIVKQYSRIKLFYEATKGDYAARNRGIEVARGTISAFTDSDSAPSSDWLRNIGAAMLDSNVGIIIGSLYFSPGSSSLSMVATYESEKSAYVFSSYTKEIYFGYTCNMVVRKTLFDRLGPFPAIYRNSDVVFVRRVIDLYSCNAVR
jgi:glycosyltransferase involved in cell wall biosynthesis